MSEMKSKMSMDLNEPGGSCFGKPVRPWSGLAGPGAMALAYATKLGVMPGGTLQTGLMYASHCADSVYCMRGIACCEYTREFTRIAVICLSFK